MRLLIEVEDALYEKARKRGLDIQTFVNVKLYEFLTGLETFSKDLSLKYPEIEAEFEQWLRTRISTETADRYLGILSNLEEITQESLINFYRSRPANNVAKAIRNLLNFLLENEMIDDKTAGKIKRVVKIKKGGSDKIIPTDDDIREALEFYRNNLAEEYYLVVLLLIFSGARLRHILKMLREWDTKYLYVSEGFAKYEIEHTVKGNKHAFFIYMPDWLVGKLRRMELSEETVKTKKITYKASSRRPVTAKYIRKWFNNLLAEMEPDKDLRSFIMGRPGDISRSVEGEYYIELRQRADKLYPLVMGRIEETLRDVIGEDYLRDDLFHHRETSKNA